MTLRHYKIFAAVCDTMNMTLAADRLFISQSAVSQAISELECHYGVRLFERLSKKLYLTQAGQKLLGYARHMIRMNAEAENDMKALCQSGTVRVGASVTVGAHVLPGIVLQFHKTNPSVGVEVIEDNTAKIEALIRKDEIDIGLVEGETADPDIVSRAFMEDELVLICSPRHPFANRNRVEPKALEQEAFLIREQGSGTRKTFEDRMSENGLVWKAIWVCNNADTIKNAVAADLGISVISRLAVQNEVNSGLLCQKEINGIKFKRQFKIIYHRNKYITAPIRQFIALLQS